MAERTKIAVSPQSRPAMYEALVTAVEDAGGEVVPISEASALMWADPAAAGAFPGAVAGASALEWVQLPYAGIENFADQLDPSLTWTCGKGVYAEPVAEHVIALTLAGFRHLHTASRATSWPAQQGRNLLGAKVTVIGGGGITESLIRLLEPWNTKITVVRRSDSPIAGAERTVTPDQTLDAIRGADVVVLAAAVTNETLGMVDSEFLAVMDDDAWLINVGRGALVVTNDLVEALRTGTIGGAALDVTDPEPLPDGHPLWDEPNCIITPHVANTPEMGLPLLAERVRLTVERWIADEALIGPVNVEAGY